MRGETMKCTRARKYILLEQSGELPGRRAAGLVSHLEKCAGCRKYRDFSIKAASDAADYLPAGELSADVMTSIRNEAASFSRNHKTVLFLRPAYRALACAAALALVVGGWAYFAGTENKESSCHLQAIIMMVKEQETIAENDLETVDNDGNTKSLADLLLIMEGFKSDGEEEFTLLVPNDSAPATSLRSRNTSVFPPKRCV